MAEGEFKKIDKYVSLNSSQTLSGIMLKDHYDGYSKKIDCLSGSTKTKLNEYFDYDKLPASIKEKKPNPIDSMGAGEKKRFLEELEKNGLRYGDMDLLRVNNDIQGGRKSYKTPVYEVNGRPVMGDHFEDSGKKISKFMAEQHGLVEKASKLGGKLASRFGGAAGGLLAAGMVASTGANASEVAAAAIPGGQSALAASQGKYMEATISGVEEVPVVGGVIGEVVRAGNDTVKAVGFNGADMEPSMTASAIEVGASMMKSTPKTKLATMKM